MMDDVLTHPCPDAVMLAVARLESRSGMLPTLKVSM